MRIKWLQEVPENAFINSGLSTIMGTVIVCIITALMQRKWAKRLSVKLFHKTFNESIWKDILDLDNGSNLKVYLRDKDYYVIGQLKNLEERQEASWLALKGFAKFDLNTNAMYKNEPGFLDNPDIIIAIRLSDVEHIEIF